VPLKNLTKQLAAMKEMEIAARENAIESPFRRRRYDSHCIAS
jgi:hypothetical protein